MCALLLPYQQNWIRDKSRHKIGMMARQCGKTFTATLEAVDDCLEAEVNRQNNSWMILSRGQRQAEESIHAGAALHLTATKAVFKILDYKWDIAGINAHEIRFANGSKITALPATPDTARGFSRNVLLDEFAFHQHSRQIWQAVYPVISAGKKIRVISTPNGKNNKFYDLMTANDKIWSRHQVDIYQAVSQGLPRQISELQAGIGDPEAWQQEYELAFLDGLGSWLSYDLISGCEHVDAGKTEKYQGGPCFLGWDIARRNDLTVFWVLELVGDVLWTRQVTEMRRQSFAAQKAQLHQIMTNYHIIRAAGDQTGIGEEPMEHAKTMYGELRVEGVIFSAARKLDMATIMRAAFEDRRLRIPLSPAIRADLHSVRSVVGPSGAPRLLADHDGGSHADRFWACALACTVAALPTQPYSYLPIGGRSAGRSDDGLGWDADDGDTRTSGHHRQFTASLPPGGRIWR
ncbi:MAG: terminase family protein [Candidatus Symbiobacter sp.]|nr:terminase family protein [Candidatus Symbiobacter sp.]